jgi:hypothetical protein
MEGAHGYRPASNNHTIKKPLLPVTAKKTWSRFSKNFKKSNNRPIKKPPVHCRFFHADIPELGLGIFENHFFEP